MQNPQSKVPAELRKKVEEALRNGQPLPPGVISVGPGQTPPANATALGEVNMPPTQHPAMSAKQAANPIADGDDGFSVLRQHSECPIPAESKKLNSSMHVLVNAEEDEAVEKALAKGLMVALRANHFCKDNLSTRTVISFESNDSLKEVHTELQAIEKEVLAIQKDLIAKIKQGKDLTEKRWKLAIKEGGLSPENHFYKIDEAAGCVEQVELKCHECKGATRIRKARQELGDLAERIQNNGGSDDA